MSTKEAKASVFLTGLLFIAGMLFLTIRGAVAVYRDINGIQTVWRTSEIMTPASWSICAFLVAVGVWMIREHFKREDEVKEIKEEYEKAMKGIKYVPVLATPAQRPVQPIAPVGAEPGKGIDIIDNENMSIEWDVDQREIYQRIYNNRGSYTHTELENLRLKYKQQGMTWLAKQIHDNLTVAWRQKPSLSRGMQNPNWSQHVNPSPIPAG